MLRLVKPYTTAPVQAATPVMPALRPGEQVLPFDVSLAQGVLEAIAASGDAGISSEALQSRFHLSAKLMAMILVTLKPTFKVCMRTQLLHGQLPTITWTD